MTTKEITRQRIDSLNWMICELWQMADAICQENNAEYPDDIQNETLKEMCNFLCSAALDLNEAERRLEMEAKK